MLCKEYQFSDVSKAYHAGMQRGGTSTADKILRLVSTRIGESLPTEEILVEISTKLRELSIKK